MTTQKKHPDPAIERLRAEKWQRLREMDQAKYAATLAKAREEKLHRLPWLKHKSPRRAFGTLVAHALNKIGYTKERHLAIKKKLRLSPTCGCAKREKSLNQFGRRVMEWWRPS
jgi:hypothetical protein